ncbi:MAG: glutaminase A [Bdellovibrionota bacterium]
MKHHNQALLVEKLPAYLAHLHAEIKNDKGGEVASYIPELAKVDPETFAISVRLMNGSVVSVGNSAAEFSLQSISKPFVYSLALAELGPERVHQSVGVEPTGNSFNSIVELEEKSHLPYNPLINSGAIAISSLIPGQSFEERVEKIRSFLSNCAGRSLSINETIFASEKLTAHRNRAIANLMRYFNVLADPIEESLDIYFKQCSLQLNCEDLATMAATLANNGVNPLSHARILPSSHLQSVLSLMFTCGMYDSAGEWAFNVGIPAKSGVCGGIIGVVPGIMGISVYSPRLDSKGHSVRGLEVFKRMSKDLGLSLFAMGNGENL